VKNATKHIKMDSWVSERWKGGKAYILAISHYNFSACQMITAFSIAIISSTEGGSPSSLAKQTKYKAFLSTLQISFASNY